MSHQSSASVPAARRALDPSPLHHQWAHHSASALPCLSRDRFRQTAPDHRHGELLVDPAFPGAAHDQPCRAGLALALSHESDQTRNRFSQSLLGGDDRLSGEQRHPAGRRTRASLRPRQARIAFQECRVRDGRRGADHRYRLLPRPGDSPPRPLQGLSLGNVSLAADRKHHCQPDHRRRACAC